MNNYCCSTSSMMTITNTVDSAIGLLAHETEDKLHSKTYSIGVKCRKQTTLYVQKVLCFPASVSNFLETLVNSST